MMDLPQTALVLLVAVAMVPQSESLLPEDVFANSTATPTTTKLLERSRRDYDHGDYHVKCKSSNTGGYAFLNFRHLEVTTF